MGRHLVLVGGGHAHLTTLMNARAFLEHGHKVTLISPAAYHYYSGMGPGVLAGIYRPGEARFHVKKMAEERGVSFVMGSAVQADPAGREVTLDTGQRISYDLASFNMGSRVDLGPISVSEPNVFPVKPIENLLAARKKVLSLLEGKAPSLLVVGGGPAGLELSGALWRLANDQGKTAEITCLAGPEFLDRFPAKVRKTARKSLEKRAVRIVEGEKLASLVNGKAVTDQGREIAADATLLAWGVSSQPFFRRAGFPVAENGHLRVNQYLQCVDFPEVFGGGDCVHFDPSPLDKVGVYPVRENPVLFENLLAFAENRPLTAFDPGGAYLLIFNLGNGKGIYYKNRRVFSGRWCFALKNYIDQRFMKRFQVSGERQA